MIAPVNCGTSFCSCIECVVPKRTWVGREELDNSIVDAIATYKAEKREELVKAVEDAWADGAAWDASEDADKDRISAWSAWKQARAALIEFDKENT